MTLYELLGVKADAPLEVIKAAYRRLAQKHHPDRNHEEGSKEKFTQIQKAWDVLSDPELRKQYDETGSIEGSGPSLRTTAIESMAQIALALADSDSLIYDPIDAVRKKLIEVRNVHAANKVQYEKAIAKMERYKKRFHLRKGVVGENIFEATFDMAIRGSRQHLAQSERMVACGNMALEILSDYEADPIGVGDSDAFTKALFGAWKTT